MHVSCCGVNHPKMHYLKRQPKPPIAIAHWIFCSLMEQSRSISLSLSFYLWMIRRMLRMLSTFACLRALMWPNQSAIKSLWLAHPMLDHIRNCLGERIRTYKYRLLVACFHHRLCSEKRCLKKNNSRQAPRGSQSEQSLQEPARLHSCWSFG